MKCWSGNEVKFCSSNNLLVSLAGLTCLWCPFTWCVPMCFVCKKEKYLCKDVKAAKMLGNIAIVLIIASNLIFCVGIFASIA